jgi:polyisoprenyl-phosphate glycosyltransferase
MNDISISTITPVYRGAKTLRDLALALDEFRIMLEQTNAPFRLRESIFVDDGSQDGSSETLQDLQNEFDWIHVVSLSKNFGQHPATIAGILYSSGDWVVTLDEDLQHHPKYIPELLEKGVLHSDDIIYANSKKSIHESLYRDFASKSIKRILAKVTGNKNMRFFNSFRVIRGPIARAASAISIDQTYFDVALSWFTNRVTVEYIELKDLRYIQTGQSGYSVRSLLSHSRRLLQTSNVKLIRIGVYLGIFAMAMGIVAAIITMIQRLFYPELIHAAGWASVFISTLLFGGLNAFLIGLVLENNSILLMQSHGKPKYFEVDRSKDSVLKAWFTQQKR